MIEQSNSLREHLAGLAKVAPHSREAGPLATGVLPKRVSHTYYNSLDQLSVAWDALLGGASSSPIQEYIWSRACVAAFDTGRRLRLIAVERGGQLAGIAPLYRRRGLPRLEILGVRELDEPMDFLYADLDALDHLAQTVAGLSLPLWIRRVPSNSPIIAALQHAYKGRGMVKVSPAEGYPYIALGEGWAEPEAKFNAGRRSDFRRARRNAQKLGPISYEISSPSAADFEATFEEALRVEAAGWKGKQGSAVEYDELRAPFYRAYAAAASKSGILRLCFMRIGEEAAAMQMAVECGGRFWLLKIGYDEKFARCSPGMLLMLETVRYAAERGLGSYEFLGGVEPWTEIWTQDVRPTVSIRAYPRTPSGILTLAADGARFAWAKLKRGAGGNR